MVGSYSVPTFGAVDLPSSTSRSGHVPSAGATGPHGVHARHLAARGQWLWAEEGRLQPE